jgi:hypothetical protein
MGRCRRAATIHKVSIFIPPTASRAEGALSSEDVKAYLGSVAAEGGMPYAKLFDISEADAALTVADLQALGRSIRQYAVDGYGPLGPLAIVVGQGQSHFQAAFFARRLADQPASAHLSRSTTGA